ncbi:MAG: molybdopterin-dependent oxidoreductase [Caldilineaceae bacterium]|nr:molybdopterin-dependent oxidoreductase [Caldilineaceae bacterium]
MSAPPPTSGGEPAWLHPQPHEPNPAPSNPDPTFTLTRSDGTSTTITVADLARLPQQSVPDCTIISTGHGTSGPFRFDGVTLRDLLNAYAVTAWAYADLVSADGFGTRVQRDEVERSAARPILLATSCDGEPLTRAQGLVRLIVPHETEDALRQVKWVAEIQIH